MMIVMMTRPLRRRLLQALPSMRSLLSSTLHHASWLRPLRYNPMMRNMIKMKSDSDDDDDEPTKNELIDMLEDVKEHFNIKRMECKDL